MSVGTINRDLTKVIKETKVATQETDVNKTVDPKQSTQDRLASLDSAIIAFNKKITELSTKQDTNSIALREQYERDLKILEGKRKLAETAQENPIKFQQEFLKMFIESSNKLRPTSLQLTG